MSKDYTAYRRNCMNRHKTVLEYSEPTVKISIYEIYYNVILILTYQAHDLA